LRVEVTQEQSTTGNRVLYTVLLAVECGDIISVGRLSLLCVLPHPVVVVLVVDVDEVCVVWIEGELQVERKFEFFTVVIYGYTV
jgi:hypothetical protein